MCLYSNIYIHVYIFSERLERESEKKKRAERRERLDYFKAVRRWIGCRNAGLLLLDLYSAPPGRHFHFRKKVKKKKERMRENEKKKLKYNLSPFFFFFPSSSSSSSFYKVKPRIR